MTENAPKKDDPSAVITGEGELIFRRWRREWLKTLTPAQKEFVGDSQEFAHECYKWQNQNKA